MLCTITLPINYSFSHSFYILHTFHISGKHYFYLLLYLLILFPYSVVAIPQGSNVRPVEGQRKKADSDGFHHVVCVC